MRVAFGISRIAFEHAKRFSILAFIDETRQRGILKLAVRFEDCEGWVIDFFFGLGQFFIWHEVSEWPTSRNLSKNRDILIRPPGDYRLSCFRGNLFQSVLKWLPIKLQCQQRLFNCTITVKAPKMAIPPSLRLLIALICFLIKSQNNKVF